MNSWDIIGDIHGEASKLRLLLSKLGYQLSGQNIYSHPNNNRVIFLGDFIDRGEEIFDVLEIVYNMVFSKNAIALMGNHEFNLLAYLTKRQKIKQSDPIFVRRHNKTHNFENIGTRNQLKNSQKQLEKIFNRRNATDKALASPTAKIMQSPFLMAYFSFFMEDALSKKNNSHRLLKFFCDWFIKLPLYIECDRFRVAHAFWDTQSLAYLKNNPIEYLEKKKRLTKRQYASLGNPLLNSGDFDTWHLNEKIIATFHQSPTMKMSIEKILKGIESKLPEELYFYDNDGMLRKKSRLKWWVNKRKGQVLLSDLLFVDPHKVKTYQKNHPGSSALLQKILKKIPGYSNQDKPVFIGHYWMNGTPKLESTNVCCLDYSVARNGKLASYRFDNEKKLSAKKICFV